MGRPDIHGREAKFIDLNISPFLHLIFEMVSSILLAAFLKKTNSAISTELIWLYSIFYTKNSTRR